jgi:hypothetical protein
MKDLTVVRIGCLASATAWRREATAIRELARCRHLSEVGRQMLLREADAADRLADDWLDAAIVVRGPEK